MPRDCPLAASKGLDITAIASNNLNINTYKK